MFILDGLVFFRLSWQSDLFNFQSAKGGHGDKGPRNGPDKGFSVQTPSEDFFEFS
jgi:hypothetical protein